MPHQRVHTIQHLKRRGYAGEEAAHFENVAMTNAAGKLKMYISLVQQLMALPKQTPLSVEALCRSADTSQSQLSSINIKRDALIRRLREAKFECLEVPETKESSRRCPHCGCTDLKALARQTRGADEGQTIFFICNNSKCGKEFR